MEDVSIFECAYEGFLIWSAIKGSGPAIMLMPELTRLLLLARLNPPYYSLKKSGLLAYRADIWTIPRYSLIVI
jgi:hypothetical protein